MEDDDLDILPTHIDDDMWIFIELERGFCMRDGLDEGDIGVEDVFQNVLRVTCRRDAQNFQLGILRFHLAAQVLEHLDRVLNRVAIRKLVRLAQDVAVFIQQDGFG